MKNQCLQFRFVGHCPHGYQQEIDWACQCAGNADGVIVIGPAINLQYRPHALLVAQAAASLGAAGCKNIQLQWAVPF